MQCLGRRRRGVCLRLVFGAALGLALLAWGLGLPDTVRAGAAISVRNGPRDIPRIALTFDDNYTGNATRVLDVLSRYDVPATVFVLGVYVPAYPSITRAIARSPAEVGDHSYSHALLGGLPWSRLTAEIGGGTDAFRRATGRRTVPLYRPPYGSTNARVREAAGGDGFLYEVLWDVDTNDWRGYSAAYIRDHVLRHAWSGSIVLMHLSAPNTAAALPGIITGLRARGYQLVTVSGLLKGHRRFLDVPASGAHAAAISRMVDLRIMSGYDADYFGPYDGITRAQLAKVIVLSGGLHTTPVDNADRPTFTDVRPVRSADGAVISYPFDYVEEAAAAGLVVGRVDGDGLPRFSPWGGVSRVHLAMIVARMARELKGYRDGPAAASGFTDLPDWAERDVALASSLGLVAGYGGGRFDPWSPAARVHVALVMGRFLGLPTAPPPPTTTTTTTTIAPPPTTTTTTTLVVPTTTTTTTAASTTIATAPPNTTAAGSSPSLRGNSVVESAPAGTASAP